MRIISLAFAAAVFFGLASSASAEKLSNTHAHKVLAEGEILHVSASETGETHFITVEHDDHIYMCLVAGEFRKGQSGPFLVCGYTIKP